VRPMDEKSTGKIGQQHRQDRVAKLLFALTLILVVSPFLMMYRLLFFWSVLPAWQYLLFT
jgi:hypothetical protein